MVSHDFRQLISFFALLKLIVLYHLQSPKVLLLHFKRFIVTQELKAGQSSGENSDENEKKQSRMEMVLRKNEVRHFMFAILWTGGPSSHRLIVSPSYSGKNTTSGLSFNLSICRRQSWREFSCRISSSQCCSPCWKHCLFRSLHNMCEKDNRGGKVEYFMHPRQRRAVGVL